MAFSPRYAARLAGIALTRPLEFADRLQIQFAKPRTATARPRYVATDWRQYLHGMLGTACDGADFDPLWKQITDPLPPMPAGWSHDSSRDLAEMAWCTTRHAHATIVVETGVARGVTSAVILSALAEHGGRLWSIDLPPLSGDWPRQSRIAVTPAQRSNWTYLRGSSKRLLPRVLEQLGSIDVFLHDSGHDDDLMRFEFERAWEALRPGGVLLSDDIAGGHAFDSFAARVNATPVVATDATGACGAIRKPG